MEHADVSESAAAKKHEEESVQSRHRGHHVVDAGSTQTGGAVLIHTAAPSAPQCSVMVTDVSTLGVK